MPGLLLSQPRVLFRKIFGCEPRQADGLPRDIERLAVARSRDEFPQIVNPPAASAVTLVEVSSLIDAELLIEIGPPRLYQSGSVRLQSLSDFCVRLIRADRF